jgi:hypothetical protein
MRTLVWTQQQLGLIRAEQDETRGKNLEVNQHIGISSGGRTTKNVIVDELGNSIYIKLTTRQTHDSTKLLKYCLT